MDEDKSYDYHLEDQRVGTRDDSYVHYSGGGSLPSVQGERGTGEQSLGNGYESLPSVQDELGSGEHPLSDGYNPAMNEF